MVNPLIGTNHGTAIKIPFLLLALSLLVLPVAAVRMQEYVNFNILGGDYDHWDVSPFTPGAKESCRDACLNDLRCTAVTYQLPEFTGTDKANCWKKEGTFTESNLAPQPYTYIWLKIQDTVILSIGSTPAGARIYLNDVDTLYTTPHDFLDKQAGGYAVRLTLSGYEDYQVGVAVNAGQTAAIGALLIPVQPATPTTGDLSISSTPSGATVIIDGISRGTTPTTVFGLTAGSHTVRVTMGGYGDYESSWVVTAGQTTPVTVSLSSATTGTISVSSTPSSASVFLDGVNKGMTPASLTGVAPGSHTVRISMAAYDDYSTTVTVIAGQVATVNAVLKTASGNGAIEVRSQPSGATINLDGSQKGTTPSKLTNVKAGSHELTLSLAGYPDWKQMVTVKGGETVSVNAVMGTAAPTTAGQTAASGTGSLSVTTIPAGAQVYVDGALIGNSPTRSSGLTAGSHALMIKMDGYKDLSVFVMITAGQTTEYSTSLVEGTPGVGQRTPGFTAVLGILAITGLLAVRRLVRP